eukprot:CAMPEP_0176212278 /NCGR_PEP_ID=MMETSP0121_2-20121125/15072_1 /TAXON_ID=160619 /ORGANISM="Kryptoperidinium foliaceum, Strain CCMP 1326" /LENGTH=253 /DNA_ID=CAMNT_0017551327 /DNA_START=529 /DNA_END=1288 /DNA_ORIENTATION=+
MPRTLRVPRPRVARARSARGGDHKSQAHLLEGGDQRPVTPRPPVLYGLHGLRLRGAACEEQARQSGLHLARLIEGADLALDDRHDQGFGPWLLQLLQMVPMPLLQVWRPLRVREVAELAAHVVPAPPGGEEKARSGAQLGVSKAALVEGILDKGYSLHGGRLAALTTGQPEESTHDTGYPPLLRHRRAGGSRRPHQPPLLGQSLDIGLLGAEQSDAICADARRRGAASPPQPSAIPCGEASGPASMKVLRNLK